MPTWGMWVILWGLLLLRGLFAAFEAALGSVTDPQVRDMGKSPRVLRLVRLRADPEAAAAALRMGMVLFGFAAAAIAVLVPPRLLDVTAVALDSSWVWATPMASALLVALLATLIDVAFRSLAIQQPQTVALALSGMASLAVTVLYPMVRLLTAPVNLLLRPFGAKVTFQPPPPPLEELERQLIRKAQRDEVDRGAPQLIRSIFQLSDKTCRDVMVPRTEVVVVDIETPVDRLLQLIAEENHSRIPVYREDMDHIVGILHVRDMVPLIQNPQLINMHDLVRPAVFVPWVKPVGDLLRDMQRQRIHMAVVVDEYGGFSGIVTLEDILREIVGDIADEFEEEVKLIEKQADGSFLVDAMLPREEFARAFDFRFPEGEFETLGGYLSHLAGAIPEVDDRFTSGGWTFQVHSKQGPRLDRVLVVKPKVAVGRAKGEVDPVPAATSSVTPSS